MPVRLRIMPALIAAIALAAAGVAADQPLDLADADVFATHGPGNLRAMLDDDEETLWAGDGTDLTTLPVNIFIRLPEPTLVGRAELVTDDLKNFIRLTRLEVYAAVGDDWALLGEARDNDQLRFTVELAPARVSLLRLRVMDTARPDHAWPRIRTLKLFPPPEGATPPALTPAPVPETASERVFVQVAMGRLNPPPPQAPYDPELGYLHYARSFMDTMLEHGTDIYGETHSPMFVSILLVETRLHPGALLPTIEGQRNGDRAPFGGNLQHDLPLLMAMEHMSAITGDDKYRAAADAYLRHFLDHCAHTPTGLWPWGEHAHCDFRTNTPGHTTHEHLGAMPLEMWETAWEMNPQAVVGEADGCLNHVVNLDTFEYNRHADIMRPLPDPRPEGLSFLDFPRHGGFYLQTWAFAYSKTGEAKYLDWIERMMDHQERVVHRATGLLPSTSSQHADSPALGSTLSCALSMLESVPLLGDTETAERVERLARGYLEAAAQHSRIADSTPGFTSHYGAGALAGSAMMYAHAHRLTGDERFLHMARAVAEKYAEVEDLPPLRHMPAQVFGSIINLLLDIHDLDGEERWVQAAERVAQQGIERLYYNGLFRGATDLWYYESELWVSNFVYALVRLHCVAEGTDYRVPPTAFQR